MTVPFDNASSFSLTCKPGVVKVQDYILDRWGPIAINSGCVTTNPNDGGGFSEHNEGRAGDTGIRPIGHAWGKQIRDWLYLNRHELGCQAIIYNGRIYQSNNGDGWSAYRPNRHDDHIHWELNWAGARAQTAWFGSAHSADEEDMTPEQAKLLSDTAIKVQLLHDVIVNHARLPIPEKFDPLQPQVGMFATVRKLYDRSTDMRAGFGASTYTSVGARLRAMADKVLGV